MKATAEQRVTVEGTLEMADFKEMGPLCRIRPLTGEAILCTFEKSKENEVYAALRKPVRITGRVHINPNTGTAEELQIEEIGPMEQRMAGARDFFSGGSIEDLAEAQGVKPLFDPEKLAGGWPIEQELDDFLEEVYRTRSMS